MIYRGKSKMAIPPGETIIEMMDDRRVTRKELASRMGVSETQINRLLDGKIAVSLKTASKLEKILGAPTYFWLNLEAQYRRDIADIAREARSTHGMPLSTGV